MVWRAMGTIICETLATRGVTITSGLAREIDGVAHKAAFQVNGVSIAVLGNGLIPFIPAMPDWLPVYLNMAELSSIPWMY